MKASFILFSIGSLVIFTGFWLANKGVNQYEPNTITLGAVIIVVGICLYGLSLIFGEKLN